MAALSSICLEGICSLKWVYGHLIDWDFGEIIRKEWSPPLFKCDIVNKSRTMLLVASRKLVDYTTNDFELDEAWSLSGNAEQPIFWCEDASLRRSRQILTRKNRCASVARLNGTIFSLDSKNFIQSRGDSGKDWSVRVLSREVPDVVNAEFELKCPHSGFVNFNNICKSRRISVDPRSLLDSHFVQLPLHDIELTQENHGSHYADGYESASEQANMARPSRHHSLVYLVLGFSATTAAVFVAVKSAEYADDHGSRFWWLPFLGFLALAFWIAAHTIPTGLPG